MDHVNTRNALVSVTGFPITDRHPKVFAVTWPHVTFVTRPLYDHRTMPCLQLPRGMACKVIAKAPCSIQKPNVREVMRFVGTHMQCGQSYQSPAGQQPRIVASLCVPGSSRGKFSGYVQTVRCRGRLRQFLPDEFPCVCHLTRCCVQSIRRNEEKRNLSNANVRCWHPADLAGVSKARAGEAVTNIAKLPAHNHELRNVVAPGCNLELSLECGEHSPLEIVDVMPKARLTKEVRKPRGGNQVLCDGQKALEPSSAEVFRLVNCFSYS